MKHSSFGIVLAAMILSACVESTPQDAKSPDSSPAEPTAVDSAVLDTAAAELPADSLEWSLEPISVDRSVPEPAIVNDVRTGRHPEYDRLVIEFQNDVIPGFDVGYLTEPAMECGSGEAIELTGEATLEIRLEPARGHNDQGQSTVDHAERQYDLPLLKEAEVSCDFEAMFTVLLGLGDRVPFHVSELRDPARLIVDVRHARDE